MWNNSELEIYLQYQRLTNYYFEPIWCNIEADRLDTLINEASQKLMQINKPVRIYKDSKYLEVAQLSILDLIKEIHQENLITWIPVNFKDRKELGEWLKNQVLKETQLN